VTKYETSTQSYFKNCLRFWPITVDTVIKFYHISNCTTFDLAIIYNEETRIEIQYRIQNIRIMLNVVIMKQTNCDQLSEIDIHILV
jgi:hypothetical protein